MVDIASVLLRHTFNDTIINNLSAIIFSILNPAAKTYHDILLTAVKSALHLEIFRIPYALIKVMVNDCGKK